jgi:hypothetical protein
MSSVVVSLYHQRFLENIEQLFAWYKIRDLCFGHNNVEINFEKALELAAVCLHPNAVWLTKLFDGRSASTLELATLVFRECENDARALCFAGMIGWDDSELRLAAELGDAFAQAMMSAQTHGEASFRWAEKSAAQGERDGFFWLGRFYKDGLACEQNTEKAQENCWMAAQHGDVGAMVSYAKFLDPADPQRFVWLGKAAVLGEYGWFLGGMSEQMLKFNAGNGFANVVFVIGRILKGHFDKEKRTIFVRIASFDTYIDPASQALHFYDFQLRSYRRAVDTWTIIGMRNSVVRDVRKMIAMIIWDAREEAVYSEKK